MSRASLVRFAWLAEGPPAALRTLAAGWKR